MSTFYPQGLGPWARFVEGDISALVLVGSGYVPNPDHQWVADVAPDANEMTAAGYSRELLTGKSLVYDDVADQMVWSCDDIDFGSPAAGQTATAIVVYEAVTNDGDSPLMAYYSIGSVQTTGAPFVARIAAAGLLAAKQGP